MAKKKQSNDIYWSEREIQLREKLLDKYTDETTKTLRKYYLQMSEKLIEQIENLYNQIYVDHKGEVRDVYLYNYRRYYEQLQQINKELKKLGEKEIKTLDKKFTQYCEDNSRIVGQSLGIQANVDTELINQIVNDRWVVGDKKHWSERIWGNNQALASKLEQSLVEIIATGKDSTALKQELMKQFNSSWKEADRLVRTELAHIHIQSTLQEYVRDGLNKYRFLTAEDEKVCEECGPLDREIFLIDSAKYGKNLPPIHPNCRCTILAVTDYEWKKINNIE